MTSKPFRTLPVALTLAVLGAASGASAQDPGAIVEAAATRYRGAAAFCADFVQERSIPLLGESRTGRGRLCQKQPNLFSMRFTDPAGDLIVADGRHYWMYNPSNDARQVIQAEMESVDGSFDFHEEFLQDAASKYDMTLDGRETVDGRDTHRIVLAPRDVARFESATLWIDGQSSLVRRVEVREENGSVTTVSLSGIDLAALPPADLFRFTPPAGVEILRP